MVKLSELKAGDLVKVDDEGVDRQGIVVRVSHDDHKVLVDNGIQEFWFEPDKMFPIPLDETQLMRLGFEKESLGVGMKYMKGPFRLVTPMKGDFSKVEMWYREDKRHFGFPLAVHELQNLHMQMTKVPLDLVHA